MNTFEKLKKGGRGEKIFQIFSLSSLLLKKHNPHSEGLLGPRWGPYIFRLRLFGGFRFFFSHFFFLFFFF
jgi:hypothetical protein